MVKEKFTIYREKLKINGMQFIPEDKDLSKKYPAFICSHGFTGNYRQMEQICEMFCEEGYAAFCFSFCGGGRTDDDESIRSDGRSQDMSALSEVDDLCAVVEYIKTLDYVDVKNINLFGESQGGFVSGMAAARLGDEIKHLVMIFPALCIPDHARRGILGGAHYNPLNVPDEIDCGVTILGKSFHEEVWMMEPYLELGAYKGPVLIIHGNEDQVVDYTYSIRAQSAYEKDQCRLQIVRNMGHSDEMRKTEIMSSVRQFMNNRKEIMNFRIILTHSKEEFIGDEKHSYLYFTGYTEGPLFTGTILPEGVDHQIRVGDDIKQICAEYTFDGLDSKQKRCHLHVVNKWGGKDWRPVIDTDSEELSWLNGAELTAVLENGSGGPTVRIYH